jgi:glutamate-ammonia-ligase adenylyltransferase
LLEEFETIRAQTLARARDTGKLREEVVGMRLKMRAELDRSDAARFDLKQGAGGLVDLEFLLQYLVLRDSSSHADLLGPRDTQGLIDALRAAGTMDETQAESLLRVHGYFVSEGLNCTLDRRPRLLPENEATLSARAVVREEVSRHGLGFDLAADSQPIQ